MRKFLLSAGFFNGDAEIIYDAEGRLVRFDVLATNMTTGMVKQFKEKLPAHVDALATAFTNVTIVEGTIDFTAEDIVREYPYKRNTHLVAPIVAKMNQTDRVLAYYAAIEYRKYCDREKKWYKPKILASWLKEKEYLNDWKKM